MSAAVANDAAPGPELAQSDLAAVKPLMYLCLASSWAGGVSAVAAALTLGFRPAPAVVASLSLWWARDASKVSAALARGFHPAPVFKRFVTAALGSSLASSVLFLAVLSLLLRAALRGVDSMAKLIKACGQPTLKRMLVDIVVPEYLSSLFFVVLFTYAAEALEDEAGRCCGCRQHCLSIEGRELCLKVSICKYANDSDDGPNDDA
ncbi:hypothetical protein EJB05_49047, partial [Eragrostis curvula]